MRPTYRSARPAILRACLVSAAFSCFNTAAQVEENGIQACAAISDNTTRLACFDAMAASLKANEANSSTGSRSTGIDGVVADSTGDAASDAFGPDDSMIAAAQPGLARQRMSVESAIADLPWAVLPYHRNYLLPVTWNNNLNREPWQNLFPGEGLQQEEAKFQISFKALAVRDVLGEGTNLWAAYTQESWWQVYNSDLSSPFRETNYQPELMFTVDNDKSLLGFTNTQLGLSFNHHSNGRSQILSRSWNRVIASADFERDAMLIRLRSWYRVPESREKDDNPSIWNYMGYGDVTLAWRNDRHEFSVLARNNLRGGDDSKGAIQLDWSFPISRRFRGYVQYFNGYGESLIDYDARTHRLGIGITLTDLL
ncbi:MAG: phospholipase A [Chromatocurvus sp.]